MAVSYYFVPALAFPSAPEFVSVFFVPAFFACFLCFLPLCFPFTWAELGVWAGAAEAAGAGDAGMFTDGMAGSAANIPAVAEASTIEVKMRIFFIGKL